jgi:predicted nucleic acid-binding protein
VPLLWHVENANLLLVAERRKRISLEQCVELLELLEVLPVQTEPETERLHGPVMRLARAHRLTMYDATYLDLAIRFAVPLATRDKALRQAASETGVTLIET